MSALKSLLLHSTPPLSKHLHSGEFSGLSLDMSWILLFTMLDKRGNSSTAERIELVDRFIALFGKDKIECLVADREFVGGKWIEYLNNNSIRYHIRIRNNFKVYDPRKSKEIPA